MANFTFMVDREHKVVAPVTLYPTVELTGEPITLNPGDAVIYRGMIELGGVPRYTFFLKDGGKGYSKDRKALEAGLEENFDELVQIR